MSAQLSAPATGYEWATVLAQHLPGEWSAKEHSGWKEAGYLFRDSDNLTLVVQSAAQPGRIDVSVLWPGDSWKWRVKELRCTFAGDRAPQAAAAHVTRSLLTTTTAQQLFELRANIAAAAEQDRQEQRNIERLNRNGHQLHDGRLMLTLPYPLIGRARCGAQHADLELRQLSIEQAERILWILREA